MRVGDLVKPARKEGTWRLGVVEAVDADGRFRVRAYVAPAGAYEGSAATYRAADLALVPVESVKAYLEVLRAEIAMKTQLERQTTDALAAASALAASDEPEAGRR